MALATVGVHVSIVVELQDTEVLRFLFHLWGGHVTNTRDSRNPSSRPEGDDVSISPFTLFFWIIVTIRAPSLCRVTFWG